MDRIDPIDPTEAIDATEPTEPIDSVEPTEPTDSTESSDHNDHRPRRAVPRIKTTIAGQRSVAYPHRRTAMARPSYVTALVLSTLSGVGYLAWRQPWLRLGASSEEARKPLPGDEVVNRVRMQATRATTINAPVDAVWPWLVQMGHGRAGWYSIDRWDNAGEPSAQHLIPELQHLEVGQAISDATGPFSFTVARVDPPRVLVFRATIHPITGRPLDPAEIDPDATGYAHAFLDFTWGFVLEPREVGRTRLLIRVRYDHQRSPWVRAMVHGYELVDTLFTRRMLDGIKSRCEAGPATLPR